LKKILLLLLIQSYTALSIESKILTHVPDSAAPWIVRVYYQQNQQIQKLSDITTIWDINNSQSYAVVMIQSEADFNKIKSLNVEIRLENALQDKYFVKNSKLKSNYVNIGTTEIDGFNCYSTVEGTFLRMNAMVDNFPNLTEVIDIGDSWEKSVNNTNGFDLKVLKITNQNIVEDKPVVFITTAIHAREYATAELTTRFAEYLLEKYNSDSDVKWMLDHQEIQLLIHTNPDGRKKAESGLLWRKNTNQAYCSPNSNNRGADLNRNYSFVWQSSNDQCAATFPGIAAQSEPEVNSVINYINSVYDDNRGELITDVVADDTPGVFLDIHSFGQLILWPWGFTNNTAPNSTQLQAFGRRAAFFNSYTPEPISDFTIAKGSSIDTSYGELGIASLAFELGTSFFQDCASFESTILPDNLQSLLYISRVARTPYITPLGPDIENLKISPNYILVNQNAKLTGVANDDHYNHSHGVQVFEQVQKVDLYVNDLPWLQQNAQTTVAADGTFDSSTEAFNANIDSAQLAVGDHVIYAVATDSNNIQGAVYSKYIHVVDASTVGSISGIITDAITGVVISGADLDINQSMSSSNIMGQYSMYVDPITDSLMIKANGYADQSITNIQVVTQQNIEQNIQLEPFCTVFSDDIESGDNFWQADIPWSIINSQSSSPTHSWSDSPNGDYANNINVSLHSDIISIIGAQNIEISFNHLCQTEAGFDFGNVEVKFDDSNWQKILSCDGETTWKHDELSLVVPANSQALRVRFRLNSDGFITEDGWLIDDINVKVSGKPCLGIFDDVIFVNGFE